MLPLKLTCHARFRHRECLKWGARTIRKGAGREIRLTPGAVVRGKIIDAVTEAPLENVRVGESTAKFCHSDARGYFELRGFSDANLDIEVYLPGYGRFCHRVRHRFVLSIGDVPPGEGPGV